MTMTEGAPDVVAAPARRTTLVAAPVLAVQAFTAAASFIPETLGQS
ncbi:MAG: hypothetical protein ABW292_21170 [Vicinamibacterales bacterium]